MKLMPLAVVGALVLALFAVLPALGAGEVRFIEPDAFDDSDQGVLKNPVETPDEQKWARQGGFIGLMYEDDSLNRPVRRVLIPFLDTTFVGRADIEAHSNTIRVVRTNTNADSLAVNDYVMVDGYSVRKALKVAPTTNTMVDNVTLDRPFYEKTDFSRDVHKIKKEVVATASASGVDWQNDYGLYAGAIDLTYEVVHRGGLTIYTGTNDVVDSNIASTYGGTIPDDEDSRRLAQRLTGRDSDSSSRPDSDDALIVRVAQTEIGKVVTGADYYTGSPTISYAVEHVRDERVEFRVNPLNDYPSQNPLNIVGRYQTGLDKFTIDKVYLAAWFEVRNDTGAAVSIHSQAYQRDTTLVLRGDAARLRQVRAQDKGRQARREQ